MLREKVWDELDPLGHCAMQPSIVPRSHFNFISLEPRYIHPFAYIGLTGSIKLPRYTMSARQGAKVAASAAKHASRFKVSDSSLQFLVCL